MFACLPSLSIDVLSTIPVWQSEMAPPKIRGFLVLFEGALITGGIMLSYWVST